LKRRVVITGGGVVSAIGIGVEAFWRSCLEGRSVVAAVPPAWLTHAELHSRLWSPLPEIDYEALGIARTERLQLDPFAMLALGASREALMNAGFGFVPAQRTRALPIAGEDPAAIGVFMGTGIGGAHTFLRNHSIHLSSGPRYHPFVVSMLMPNAASAVVANKFSIHGPNVTYCVACASGTVAVGHAYRAVRDGQVALAISGGAEFLDDEHGHIFRGFDVAGTLVRDCADPDKANRPFDDKRSGFLFSQGGAAVLVLEELERAQRRRAPIMAELAGFAETFDAHSMMSLAADGGQIERMIRASLADAGLDPGAVDYVNAHGTGTQNNDAIEGEVIRRVFADAVAVNSTKSLLGHTIGASGAFEALVTALTLRDGRTHINRNLDAPCCELNFVRSTQAFAPQVGLSQSFAFGGHNAALVLRRWTGGRPPG
jgi:3-oxoacyl-[acyl-carrier-protein] synthase II